MKQKQKHSIPFIGLLAMLLIAAAQGVCARNSAHATPAEGDTLFITASEKDITFSSDSLRREMLSDGEIADSAGNVLQSDSLDVPARPKPRTITPVDVDDNKPPVVMHYYDKHGEPLKEPVMFLATLDTVTKPKSKPIYPLYNGIAAGVNFADAIMIAGGQSYGNFGVWADVSLHNWFFPTVEFGLGFADSSPKNSNFIYKTKPSFYGKIGLNYNFLYKSNPDYQVFVGLRGGFSSFSYDVDNVTISDGYWDQENSFSMKGIKATALFGEALAGIRVKIWKRFSMGWSVRYHFKFKVNSSSISTPWFIPGYGASSPISLSLSAIYVLPGPKQPEPPEVVE